jgi:hypothetical protein
LLGIAQRGLDAFVAQPIANGRQAHPSSSPSRTPSFAIAASAM